MKSSNPAGSEDPIRGSPGVTLEIDIGCCLRASPEEGIGGSPGVPPEEEDGSTDDSSQ